jgi:hypothetical protein
MVNPWIKLSAKAPYILKGDFDIIEKFNKKAKDIHKIRYDLLPEPYSGDPFEAEIILLQLNPGTDSIVGYEGEDTDFIVKRFPSYRKDLLKNLLHKENKYPFFNLNPEYRLLGGFRYWSQKLSPFIKTKEDYKRLAEKVCVIEFFPYHSKKYNYSGKVLESQNYTFELVRKAIKRKAIIILMRGKKQWLSNVPSLNNKYINLRSNQNVTLSKNNLGSNFKKINNILK